MTKEADEALVALKARRAVRGELEQAAPSSQSCDRGQLVCFGGMDAGKQPRAGLISCRAVLKVSGRTNEQANQDSEEHADIHEGGNVSDDGSINFPPGRQSACGCR